MFDSRHAPRYLRWFDRIALFGGLAVLLALMLMLASMFSTLEKQQEKSSWRSHSDEARLVAEATEEADHEN